ncbi:hypothetical protein MTR67_002882 [Solanum verrucosum]|uniref:Uncharacterized protein n=1 Tax=Solanum verrucosum TaxID=315347 RepID=A0AAF0PRV3_SOLVR|nr:hypothetical protein MTR67_002882 [Solanum verrucosum]
MTVAEFVVAGGDYMGVWEETPKSWNCKSFSKMAVPIALRRNGSYDDMIASSKVYPTFRYAPEMVVHMRSRIRLFVVGLPHLSSKEGKTTMPIGDMDITRLMIYVQQVEEDKLRNSEEFQNKRAKRGNEFGHQKSNANHSSFQ